MKTDKHAQLHGLYAITDARDTDNQQLLHKVAQALRGGVRILQYRDKTSEQARRRDAAQQLRRLCNEHQALLIINDDVQLAHEVAADGVHLGQDDAQLVLAREILGEESIIGVSCYNRFELAQQAASAGADYVAFGRFFPSRTKPDAAQADPGLLQRAQQELDIPVAAIGGITTASGAALVQAGADMLAVVEDIFGQQDIAAAAHRYHTLFIPQ